MSLLTVASARRRAYGPPGPRTGYETHGDLTTLEEEATFWTQVAAETALTSEVAGTSPQGRPIRKIAIGSASAGRTMLIVCARHGYEKASREGALALMRNLAYSTDPTITDYLANHRIVLIPVYNIDAFATGEEGPKGEPDLQGDVWRPSAGSTAAYAQIWADEQPSVHVDAHTFGSGPVASPPSGSVFGAWPTVVIANAHPDIKTLTTTNGPGAAMIAAVNGLGHQTSSYTSAALPGAAGADGSLNHAVSITTELNSEYSRAVQYTAMLAALDALVSWHATNGAAAAAARAASMAAPSQSGFVPSYFDGGGALQTVSGLLGYTVLGTIDPVIVQVWGVQPPVNNFVTIEQPAGLAIPQMLDRDSPVHTLRTATVTRVMA